MGILPEAGNLQKVINSQSNKANFFAVGGSANINLYETLLEFKIVNFVSFDLAITEELGYLYQKYFTHSFTFIGKNNAIIESLDNTATAEEIELALKRTLASFDGLYSKSRSDRVLLTGNSLSVDLSEFFYIGNNVPAEISVVQSTNPAIVNTNLIDKNLILERTSATGYTELTIRAQVPGKDGYIQTVLEVINPSSVYEDFEIQKIEDSDINWVMSGDAPWYITSEESYFGKKSLRSGPILMDQTSAIEVALELTEPGVIVFAYKTSTRDSQDLLHFYMDSLDYTELETPELWSGLKDWRIMYFNIRGGSRKFKWEYRRSPYAPGYEDAVWIDLIVLPDKYNKNNKKIDNSDDVILSSFPNPFNPVTEISFELIKNENIELIVFDVKGRQVADIHKGMLDKGTHSFSFDGSRLSSGIYYSVLKYGDKMLTNKLILAK